MTTTKIRFALAALALAVAGSANASTIYWGSITAPETKTVSNDFGFWDDSHFSDRYNFTLTDEANSLGGLLEIDPKGSFLGIDLDYVALYKGFTKIKEDHSPGAFNFGELGAGSYSFYVVGSITKYSGGWGSQEVGYTGHIDFKPVPEPSTLTLAGIGLLGLAFAVRRRLFN